MTKTELIETITSMESKVAELEAQIQQQVHLAQAIEAKDAEINKLNSVITTQKEDNKRLQSKIDNDKHLAKAVEAKDAEINALKEHESHAIKGYAEKVTVLQNEIQQLKDKFASSNQVESAYKDLEQRHNKAVYLLEKYILAFRALAQIVSGAVDNAVMIDESLKEKLK